MTTNSSLKPGVTVWHRYTGAEAVVADMHGAPGVVYVNPVTAPSEVWLWKTGSVTTTPNSLHASVAAARPSVVDPVDLPPHYRHLPVECIDVTEHFNFCLGNALKYIWRADHKGNPIQDIQKAIWYLRREVERRERGDG